MMSIETNQQLKQFLDQFAVPIRAIRSYAQSFDNPYVKLDPQTISELENLISQHSNSILSPSSGWLCEIGDGWYEFQHHGRWFMDPNIDPDLVRGFYFEFEMKGVHFECIDLDGEKYGPCRRFFDNKTADQQDQFLIEFAQRWKEGPQIYFGDPNELPIGNIAVIKDDGDKFEIEKQLTFRYLPPRT